MTPDERIAALEARLAAAEARIAMLEARPVVSYPPYTPQPPWPNPWPTWVCGAACMPPGTEGARSFNGATA